MCTICASCVDSRTTGTAHCSCKRLDHPPYFPDLSPPESFVFPKLKMELKGHRHATINDIQTSVTRKLKTIPTTDFSQSCIGWKIAPTSVLQLMVITLNKKNLFKIFLIFLGGFRAQSQNLWDVLCMRVKFPIPEDVIRFIPSKIIKISLFNIPPKQ